jgi:1-acyl-sn-glycerol-3-phosphate acyltransferase
MAALLRDGSCVALFPEGTTTDGTSVTAFHSGLFEPAIEADAFVWPIAIHYRQEDGRRDPTIAFLGDETLIASILRVLARPTTEARLSFAHPIDGSACNRRALASRCQDAIERDLGENHSLPHSSRPPLQAQARGQRSPRSAARATVVESGTAPLPVTQN